MKILEKIIKTKQEEIKEINIDPTIIPVMPNQYSLVEALKKPGLTLIAEVKQASPSKGIIYDSFNPKELAETFQANGAGAISVLTDRTYFKGSINDLKIVRQAVDLPILRKDFIIDPIQVIQSKIIGANAILLILDIVSIDTANEILDAANQYELDVLIEIHHIETIEKLNDLNSKQIVGINNRNLNTFEVDTNHALELTKKIKAKHSNLLFVAESGYSSTNSLETLEKSRLNGVLIGEGLSKNQDLLGWFNEN